MEDGKYDKEHEDQAESDQSETDKDPRDEPNRDRNGIIISPGRKEEDEDGGG